MVSRDDLVSWGSEGLVTAARLYKDDKNALFKTYAFQKVFYSILNGSRANNFNAFKIRVLAAAARRFDPIEQKLGRVMSVKEKLEFIKDKIDDKCEAALLRSAVRDHTQGIREIMVGTPPRETLSDFFTALIESNDLLEGIDNLTPEQSAVANQIATKVWAEVYKLPAKERLTIRLIYLRGYDLRQIADVFGVCMATCSLWKQSALKRLRRRHKDFYQEIKNG